VCREARLVGRAEDYADKENSPDRGSDLHDQFNRLDGDPRDTACTRCGVLADFCGHIRSFLAIGYVLVQV
jgi:hypothetical protein